MNAKKKLGIDREELGNLQGRLAGFMNELPDNQRGVSELMMARAASSEASSEVVNGSPDVTRKDKIGSPSVLCAGLGWAL